MERYLNADWIYEQIENRYRMSSGIQHQCEREFLNLICEAPTADVAEVKHGYWANEDFPEKIATINDSAICSICNNSAHKAEHGYSILSDYCPHCGAKMDKGGTEL